MSMNIHMRECKRKKEKENGLVKTAKEDKKE